MLLPLANAPRDYAWGSATLLAGLEGRAPSGRPEAEVWFGDHPGDPADVGDGSGRTLDRWLAEEGAAAGAGIRLPYLLKLLAAERPLSIQAHPSRAQAEAGFAREDAAGVPRDAAHRNYRDANHKPELIVALSAAFHALAGLRDPAATGRLLAGLGDAPGVRALRERLDGADAARLGAIVPWLLSADAAETVSDVLAALPAATSAEFAGELAVARRLAHGAPGDAGVVVALLMNLLTLHRGEGLFVPAGVLHAYVDGLGVELMAASDNVLRGGLTPKHVDVDELARVLDATPGLPAVLHAAPVAGATGDVAAYPVPVPDFELVRVRVAAGSPVAFVPRGTAIALAVDGEAAVRQGDDERVLVSGQAVLATPSTLPLVVRGAGEVFVAQPGR
ncbi:MAG: mannose-6-phosphate isomerase, class I [Microbacterium sp.]